MTGGERLDEDPSGATCLTDSDCRRYALCQLAHGCRCQVNHQLNQSNPHKNSMLDYFIHPFKLLFKTSYVIYVSTSSFLQEIEVITGPEAYLGSRSSISAL